MTAGHEYRRPVCHQMEPVAIWRGVGVSESLTTFEDAALCLLHQWPEQHCGTERHLAAQNAVSAFLHGEGSADAARSAFEVAAMEAQTLTKADDGGSSAAAARIRH